MSQTVTNIKIQSKKTKEDWSVGSGFLWDKETVITCAHVIDDGLKKMGLKLEDVKADTNYFVVGILEER